MDGEKGVSTMRFGRTLYVSISLGLLIGIAYASNPHSANSENCLGCHGAVLQGQTKHFVESNDDCMFCHERTPAGEILSFESDNLVCVACHANHEVGLSTADHSDLSCTECHDPHSSDQTHLFVRTELSVCGNSCHGSHDLGTSHPTGDGVTNANTGEMVTCVSTCHSMHTPGEEKMLQMASTDLCLQCHDEKF